MSGGGGRGRYGLGTLNERLGPSSTKILPAIMVLLPWLSMGQVHPLRSSLLRLYLPGPCAPELAALTRRYLSLGSGLEGPKSQPCSPVASWPSSGRMSSTLCGAWCRRAAAFLLDTARELNAARWQAAGREMEDKKIPGDSRLKGASPADLCGVFLVDDLHGALEPGRARWVRASSGEGADP